MDLGLGLGMACVWCCSLTRPYLYPGTVLWCLVRSAEAPADRRACIQPSPTRPPPPTMATRAHQPHPLEAIWAARHGTTRHGQPRHGFGRCNLSYGADTVNIKNFKVQRRHTPPHSSYEPIYAALANAEHNQRAQSTSTINEHNQASPLTSKPSNKQAMSYLP